MPTLTPSWSSPPQWSERYGFAKEIYLSSMATDLFQLVDTGRFFRKNGSMPASTHLQRSIPSYYESFQNALDSLSEQIVSKPLAYLTILFRESPNNKIQFIAKAFLEKDYEAIKALETAPEATEDVTMNDGDQQAAAETQPVAPVKPEPGVESAQVGTKAEEDAATEVLQAQSTEAIPEAQPSIDVKEEKKAENEAARAETAFPDSTEALNFDSVLNENGGSNAFDLHLDFGNDDMGNQAFLSGTSFENATPSGTDKPGTSQPTDNEIAASAGGGAFDLELQDTNPDGGTEDIIGPGESSFDDLFMENENFGESGTGDLNHLEGDSLMNLNELDDNWFT